jgi:hypothetical protein
MPCFTLWRIAAIAVVAGMMFVASETSSAQSITTITQIVNQADPGLIWAAPAAIPFGTPLDASNLHATAVIAGSFVYDPAAGALLSPGAHTLSVRFQPTNSNFHTGVASVVLQVLPPGDSTFRFSLEGTGVDVNPILLRRGHPAIVRLVVAPVNDFHQPVSFACGHTEPRLVCVFSPATVRPVATPVDVTLTVSLAPTLSPGPIGASSSAAPGALGISVGILSMLMLPTSRRRSIHLRGSKLMGSAWALVLALPLTFVLAGCTWGDHLTKSQMLPVTASSLLESQALDLRFIVLASR